VARSNTKRGIHDWRGAHKIWLKRADMIIEYIKAMDIPIDVNQILHIIEITRKNV